MVRRRLILWILALPVMAAALAWVAARMLIINHPLQQADSIVILAGSSTYKERVQHAAALFREGRAPRVILLDDHQRGGWSAEKQINPLFVEFANEQLQTLGVQRDRIDIVSESGLGTFTEANSVREFAVSRKLRSLLVVTSAYHSRRTLWTYQKVFAGSGIDIGLDPVPPGQQSPAPATWWLHLKGWEMVPLEWIKLVFYRLRY